MAEDKQKHNSMPNVSEQVFEQFLTLLEIKDVSAEVIARLKVALLEKGDLTEASMRQAIFSEKSHDID